MELKNKNILLISPESWEHLFVSKHHYATHLAEMGNKVFFLNPPGANLRVDSTKYNNLWNVNYKGFPKGLRFYPVSLQRFFIKKAYNTLQKLCLVNFDIVWSFDNSVFYDFSALPKNVYSVSHIVDLNQNFQTEKAASSANICFGVIEEIVVRLKAYNKNTHLIPHGVKISNNYFSENPALPGQNGLKALYMGNLAMPFVDWALLNQLVKNFSEVDFVFVGSNIDVALKNFQVEPSHPNIFFVNSVSADKIQAYLNQADVLLLSYTPEYYQTYASPHKMMEYMASGKAVLASWTPEYETLHEKKLILMAKNHQEFLTNFKATISDLDGLSNKEREEFRKSFAKDNSYEKQIQRIELLMNQD